MLGVEAVILKMDDDRQKKESYYDILGIPSNASPVEIKKAYLKLAREYHPDRRPGDREAESKFAEITQAYSTLSNPASRYGYDLELGIEPGEKVIPTYERIEQTSVTGSAAADYVETLAGGIPVPRLTKVDKETYEFRGLDNPRVREAYEKGLFSIGMLEKADMHRYYNLGLRFLRGKRFNEAIAYCIEAVRINPGNLQFRFALGCCFEATGLLKEAVEEYEQALKLGAGKKYTCLPVREALISLHLKRNNFQEVKRHCKELWNMGLASTLAERALHIVRLAEKEE